MSFPDMEITNQSTVEGKTLEQILQMPDKEAECLIFGYVRHFDDVVSMSYARVGLLCRTVQAYSLHEQRTDPETGEPCSFHRWVQIAAPRAHATCYAALRDVEALQDMPDEAVAQIPASNFSVVRQLSTTVRNDPQVIEAIKSKPAESLVEHIRQNHPDQHIEHKKLVRVWFEESAYERIEAVVKMAEAKGAKNWAEALELIAEEAADVWRTEQEIAESIAHETEA